MRSSESKDKLVDLYNRIPDYSQVKHLGNSDFIKTLEQLKEEFRQCRASLHELDSSDDVDYISRQTTKILNISKGSDDSGASTLKLTTKNVNITKKAVNVSTTSPTRHYTAAEKPENYLSVRSCALHNPNELSFYSNTTTVKRYDPPKFNDEDLDLCSDGFSTPESGISKWSSSPELYRARSREVSPPANVERRLLIRRAQNWSAPSIPDLEDEKPKPFRAHPVPEHVHKPLFDYIMLKNKRRSMRVRERSKQRLMAQMKPFSFPHDSKVKPLPPHGFSAKSSELLNNARPTKKKKQCLSSELRNKFDHHTFRAHPAPPRSKALLSAIKLKEQQEYRELKKKLRAEALMKSASLPPSMAARDRVTRHHCARLDDLLSRYNAGTKSRGSSVGTYSDDDLTHDGIWFGRQSASASRPGTSSKVQPCKKLRNFTPYGEPRFPHSSSATDRIFESTSNDNHASRLRVQVAKAKEQERMKREEEELMRQMKMDKKRQKLRDAHALAWRIARSYSSSQDIAMRRQLRMAAAILERENYKKDMSSMLSRVRSAPLLLEGVRERKSEPCKKHRDELYSGRKSPSKLSPRHETRDYKRSTDWTHRREDAGEKSETAALAEGTLTTSDVESVKNLETDEEEDIEEQQRIQNDQVILSRKQNNHSSPKADDEDAPNDRSNSPPVQDNNEHEDEIVDECEDDFEDDVSDH